MGTVTPNMGQLTTWTLVILGFGFALSFDLSTVKRFPAGLDLRKIQNLMRIVDPKTCGCARPEQHCEVPVPEARFVGFSCKVGTFCCRMKKQPGRPNLKDFQRLLPTQQDSRSSQQLTRTRTSPTKQVLNINKEPVQKKEKVLKKQFTTQNHPIYNHNEIKTEAKKDDIEGIEPHQLGLPKDIKAFIKPVSQLQHRVLIAPVEETTEKKKDDKICKCEDTDDCPQEQRDYITFRKSCPFGQVQCCKNSELVVTLTEEKKFQAIAPETGREILSTTSKKYPVQPKPQQPWLHQPRLQQPRPQQPRPQQPRPQQPRPQQPRPHQPRPHQPRPQQPRPQQPRPQQPRPQQPRPQQPRPQQPRPPQTKQSFQQPIPGQIINRADTINQQFQPRQMGFVESVGDAAIKLVTKLFSWPF